jgi:hypothetical protein
MDMYEIVDRLNGKKMSVNMIYLLEKGLEDIFSDIFSLKFTQKAIVNNDLLKYLNIF